MWAALALGLIGLIIFVQYPAGGVPFLLVAAILAWPARARIQRAVASLGHRASPPPTTPPAREPRPMLDITLAGALRLALTAAAGLAALCGLCLLVTVASEARHGVVNWSYSGVGLLLALSCGWAAWSIWQFRHRLIAPHLLRQLTDGAARLTLAAIGSLIVLWVLSWAPSAIAGDWLLSERLGACVGLPGFAFLAAAALGYAYRDRLSKLAPDRPALRAALWAAAAGGMIGAVASVAAIYVHIAAHPGGRFPDLALTAWGWAACCGMIAVAALSNARSPTAGLRRFAAGYGGAVVCALACVVPALWVEAFTSGQNLAETWNVFIFLMPFVCIGSLALAAAVMFLGWRVYQKAF